MLIWYNESAIKLNNQSIKSIKRRAEKILCYDETLIKEKYLWMYIKYYKLFILISMIADKTRMIILI